MFLLVIHAAVVFSSDALNVAGAWAKASDLALTIGRRCANELSLAHGETSHLNADPLRLDSGGTYLRYMTQ
jgi:predicted regulator of Ras-like GTPase activity (Roadblock/LC7/MglB family)